MVHLVQHHLAVIVKILIPHGINVPALNHGLRDWPYEMVSEYKTVTATRPLTEAATAVPLKSLAVAPQTIINNQ